MYSIGMSFGILRFKVVGFLRVLGSTFVGVRV